MMTKAQTQMIRFYRDMIAEKEKDAESEGNWELADDLAKELIKIEDELDKNGFSR